MSGAIEPETLLRIRREVSLTVLLRREIERMIERGELSPGDWVNEAMLAARFGVSRGPVREACRGLEQGGLLSFVVNRGAFVREITSEEAGELYELRAVLFGAAGRLLAPRITAGQVAALSALIARMEAAAGSGDLDAYYKLNLEFHRALLTLAGNRRIAATYENAVRELHLFRRRALVPAGRMTASNREHRAILEALAGHRAASAERRMAAHVRGAKRRIDAASA